MATEGSKFTTKVGDRVIIMITGMTAKYIAEVIQAEPLRLKVEEKGPFAKLKDGSDFIIAGVLTEEFQDEGRRDALLAREKERGYAFLSGLASLGVTDGRMHEIWPQPETVEP